MLNKKLTKVKTISTLMLGVSLAVPGGLEVIHLKNIKKSTKGAPSLTEQLRSLSTSFSYLGQAFAGNGGGQLAYTQNLLNIIRSTIGASIGYSKAGYIAFVCNGDTTMAAANCQGPPLTGITGAITAIANTLPAMGVTAGITSCSAIPASGTASAKDTAGNTVVLTFATPTHTIPASWTGGGVTFQKRVTFAETMTMGGQSQALKVAMEFNCGASTASYTTITMPISNPDQNGTVTAGQNGNGYTRSIAVFSGPVSSTLNGFDVYYGEALASGVTVGSLTGPFFRGGSAIKVEYNPTTTTFNLWGALAGQIQLNSQSHLLGHMIVAGNYTSGAASVYFNGIEESPLATVNNQSDINIAQMNTDSPTVAADSALGTAVAFDLNSDLSTSFVSSTIIKKQGCSNFTTPNIVPSSATLCSGLPLTAASSAPALDSTGSFSASWMLSTMLSKMEVLK